jgi:hypothetical protein
VDLEEQGRLRRDGLFVVAKVRLVRGADLDHLGAGLPHDVGDAEGAADLHELAPGDDRLLAGRERRDAEQDSGGVVVDRHARLGARDVADQLLDVDVAAAALAGRGVVFKRRVVGARLEHGTLRGVCEHAAAEVGVHDDAGGVHDPAKAWPHALLDKARRLRGQRVVVEGRVVAREHAGARGLDRVTHGLDDHGPRLDGLKGREVIALEQLVGLGEFAQQ